nr:MAG TPA: hypothetical protein [Caudoviricetes sp.]
MSVTLLVVQTFFIVGIQHFDLLVHIVWKSGIHMKHLVEQLTIMRD